MDIVGCDDNFKIDLSQYSETWSHELYDKLKSFPKEYFSTAKTFYFDFDNTINKFIAGWTDKISTYDKDEIKKIVRTLFFLCDINPDLVDKNFDFDSVVFNDVLYENLESFIFEFEFKGQNLDLFFGLPISNFCKKSNFYEFDFFKKTINFFKSNKNCFWKQKFDDLCGFHEEEFFNFLKSKNIAIKNRPAIVLEANKICLKDPLSGNYTFNNEQCKDYEDLLYFLKILNYLKDCNFIDVEEVSLDFGGDENSLNLGNFDLLNFNFGKYYIFNKDVAYFLSLLFKLFDVDYTVKFNGRNGSIKLSTNEKTYSYKLDFYSHLEKVKA